MESAAYLSACKAVNCCMCLVGHGCNYGSIVRWRETVRIGIIHVIVIIIVNISDAGVLRNELVVAVVHDRISLLRVFLGGYILQDGYLFWRS